jgi:hypothetical protein
MENENQRRLNIGITGYSAQKFDNSEAQRMLREAYDKIHADYPDREKYIVSGLTDLGIPALAYREAVARGWKTVGIACSKASEYACFPVDEKIIEGNDWGQESPRFLDTLEVLVRIGGGGQARRETAEAKVRGKPVIEYDLPALK